MCIYFLFYIFVKNFCSFKFTLYSFYRRKIKLKIIIMNSTEIINKAKERFKDLEHKGFEWKSFYNGFLEDFVFLFSAKQKINDMKELWIEYKFGESHPPKPGRYLVYRQKCDKWHQEVWNGTGWASNNNDISHYINVITP